MWAGVSFAYSCITYANVGRGGFYCSYTCSKLLIETRLTKGEKLPVKASVLPIARCLREGVWWGVSSYLKSVRQSQIINIWRFGPWRGNIIHQHADRQSHIITIKLSCCHNCFCMNVNYGLFLCAVWYFCWIFCSSLFLKFEISPFQTGQQNSGTRSYHFSPSTCPDLAGRMLDMFQLIF